MTVLKNLIENKNEPTYISGIARETGLSNSIVSKVLIPLAMWDRCRKTPWARSELSI
jgi:hypothetical protein